MRAEFVNPFLASLMNVLKTMASLELKPQKPRIKKDEIARGDVSGLIGMIGPTTRGSMSITFDESLALEIMQNMLGERPNGLNEEVTDMVGEITNMVTGGAKRILAESGFDFDMATPLSSPAEDTQFVISVKGNHTDAVFFSLGQCVYRNLFRVIQRSRWQPLLVHRSQCS